MCSIIDFYLQPEGDPLLKPLESAYIKVKANKYRILAQSPLNAGQGVDIRIRYHHPTHPQNFDYHQKVNDEGNIVIMPLMQLYPGEWEISCCSDLISELVGEYWEKSLYFQVEVESALATKINPNPDYLQELETIMQRDFAKLRQKLTNFVTKNPEVPEILPLTVHLILEETEIVRQLGDPIVVTGQIEIENNTLNQSKYLHYELRDPLTQELQYEKKQSLSSQSSFFAFYHCLEIPETIETSELCLIAKVITDKGEILTQEQLIVITEIPEIIEDNDNYLQYTLELSDLETQTAYIFDIMIEKPENPLSIPVQLPETPKTFKPLRQTKKSSDIPLPPRILPKKESSKPKNSLQLPNFFR